MKRLNGVDALMLYSETPQIHMHTLKIAVLDVSDVAEEFSFDVFRRVATPRLSALAPLHYQLVPTPLRLHHPMWQVSPRIDFDYHLRQVRVRPPGGRRELDRLLGQIASSPLDRRHPLWVMYVVEGLLDGRVAVIHKVHHALADGVASANQLATALNLEPPTDRRPCGDTSAGTAQLLRAAGRDHLRQIGAIPRLIADTTRGMARVRRRSRERGRHPDVARNFAPPATFINHAVSAKRRFATAPLPLGDVKEIGKRLGATVNDMVLAIAAGAIRELLLRYDGVATQPLIAGVPASFNTSADRLTGNEFSYMTPSLPVHVADPLERVRLVSLSANEAKENHRLLGPSLMAAWTTYLPPAVAPVVFAWQSRHFESNAIMNLTISNVSGPRASGRIHGATVSEFYSVGPLVVGSGLNITVWSYVDQLNISALTDDATLADPHEVTTSMLAAFADIRSAAGFPGPPTELDSVLPFA